MHSLRIARGVVDTMEERPARPRAELTTTKNLVTRIGIGINALRTAVNKATDSAGTLSGDSTAEEIRQTEYLQGKAISIFNEVDEDTQEILTRREKVGGGLINVDAQDIECTATVENDASIAKGQASGLIEAMSKTVKDKIKGVKTEQRTEQLKHEAELNKVRNTPPPVRTPQQGGGTNSTTNTSTQKIFKACAEVKPKNVMTYECQFSELDYYVTAFRSYYQMSENTQNVLASQQQALLQSLVDSTLWSKVKERIEENATFEDCVKTIETIFAEKFPVLHRRMNSLKTVQQPQESHLDYMTRFKKLGREADFEHISVEQLLSLICINNTKNQKIKEKFLEIKVSELSLAKITEVSRELSQILSSLGEGDMRDSSAKTVDKKDKRETICFSCNGKNHMSFECRTKAKLICSDCGEREHRNKDSAICRLNTSGGFRGSYRDSRGARGFRGSRGSRGRGSSWNLDKSKVTESGETEEGSAASVMDLSKLPPDLQKFAELYRTLEEDYKSDKACRTNFYESNTSRRCTNYEKQKLEPIAEEEFGQYEIYESDEEIFMSDVDDDKFHADGDVDEDSQALHNLEQVSDVSKFNTLSEKSMLDQFPGEFPFHHLIHTMEEEEEETISLEMMF